MSCVWRHERGGAPVAKTEGEAKWVKVEGLNHAGPSAIPVHESPEGATIEIDFKSSDPFWNHDGTFVWWAAAPRSLADAHLNPCNPPTAYKAHEGWPNCGKTTRREDGRVHIRLQAPQPYLEKGSLWPRHVHFMRSTDESSVDPSSVFTVGAWPSHHEEDYKCHCVSECGSCSIVTPEIVRNVLQGGRAQRKVLAHQCDRGGGQISVRGREFHRAVLQQLRRRDPQRRQRCGHVSRGRVLCQTGGTAASQLIRKLAGLGLCSNLFHMPAGYMGFSTA